MMVSPKDRETAGSHRDKLRQDAASNGVEADDMEVEVRLQNCLVTSAWAFFILSFKSCNRNHYMFPCSRFDLLGYPGRSKGSTSRRKTENETREAGSR